MTLQIETLTVDNATIAWAWVGEPSSSPVVFLHGLGDSAIMTFERIARHPALADSSSLLVDLPGFGYGQAPDDWPATMADHARAVVALLDHVDVRSGTVVGHSMGGSLALLVTAARPARVGRLVLAEPLLVREQSELGKAIAKRPERAFVERGYAMLVLATRRQALRGEQGAQGFRKPLERASPTMLHRSAVSLLDDRIPSFLDLLHDLHIERTVLIGERSHVDERMVPNTVHIEIIPGAGHSMMIENPDAIARVISAAHRNPDRRAGLCSP